MTKNMGRFTLQRGVWYACEIMGDEFDKDKCSYSPIKVYSVEPQKTGQLLFVLHFYHANYPEGVRHKKYSLKMIERGRSMLLAKSQDHDPPRYLFIYEITADWINRHFPHWLENALDIQGWLNRNA